MVCRGGGSCPIGIQSRLKPGHPFEKAIPIGIGFRDYRQPVIACVDEGRASCGFVEVPDLGQRIPAAVFIQHRFAYGCGFAEPVAVRIGQDSALQPVRTGRRDGFRGQIAIGEIVAFDKRIGAIQRQAGNRNAIVVMIAIGIGRDRPCPPVGAFGDDRARFQGSGVTRHFGDRMGGAAIRILHAHINAARIEIPVSVKIGTCGNRQPVGGNNPDGLAAQGAVLIGGGGDIR